MRGNGISQMPFTFAASLKRPQQPFDVVALDGRPVALSGAAPQLVADLPCALQLALLRDLDVAAVQPLRAGRHRAPERVEAGVHVAEALLLAPRLLAPALTELLHQLLGRHARALLQLVDRLALRIDRLARLPLFECLPGIAHRSEEHTSELQSL